MIVSAEVWKCLSVSGAAGCVCEPGVRVCVSVCLCVGRCRAQARQGGGGCFFSVVCRLRSSSSSPNPSVNFRQRRLRLSITVKSHSEAVQTLCILPSGRHVQQECTPASAGLVFSSLAAGLSFISKQGALREPQLGGRWWCWHEVRGPGHGLSRPAPVLFAPLSSFIYSSEEGWGSELSFPLIGLSRH